MLQLFKRAGCAFVALSLAACGGSSHAGRFGNGIEPLPQPAARSSASITIKIPHRNNPQAVARYLSPPGRSRNYISPASQSIAIAVTDSKNVTTTTNASLTLTAAGSGPNPVECTSGALSTLCTVVLPLNPGTYSASFTTYDGPLNSSNVPTGNELSKNQNVPFTVVSGKNNTLVVSLAAVPGSVSIVPAANEKLVRGSGTPSFALIALGVVHRFNVFAFDADGDPIVGPGAPTWSVGETGPTGDIAITEPTTAAPNTFTISTVKPIGGAAPTDPKNTEGVSITLFAAPPAGSGVTCTSATCEKTVMIDSIDAAFVGYATGASLFVESDLQSFADTTIAASTSTIDKRNGDIFFANGNTVYEWKPPYDVAPITLFQEPSIPAVLDLTIDPNGVLYYEAQQTATRNDVYRSTPPYDGHADFLTGFSFADTTHDYHNRILADASGHVFVADDTRIFITKTDMTNQQSIPATKPFIAFDGSGELIAYDSNADTLSSYQIDGSTGLYGLAVTNNMLNGGVAIPLRAETNNIYVYVPMASSLAEYSVPLSTGGPTLQAIGITSQIDDYEITANESGLISVANASQGIPEIPNFTIGDVVTAFAAGGPQTLTIVH